MAAVGSNFVPQNVLVTPSIATGGPTHSRRGSGSPRQSCNRGHYQVIAKTRHPLGLGLFCVGYVLRALPYGVIRGMALFFKGGSDVHHANPSAGSILPVVVGLALIVA
jgi:hypothetical protein